MFGFGENEQKLPNGLLFILQLALHFHVKKVTPFHNSVTKDYYLI